MTTTMDETWPKQALALYYVDMKDDVDDDDGVLFYTYENKKIKRRKGRIELVVCHHCSTRQRQYLYYVLFKCAKQRPAWMLVVQVVYLFKDRTLGRVFF